MHRRVTHGDDDEEEEKEKEELGKWVLVKLDSKKNRMKVLKSWFFPPLAPLSHHRDSNSRPQA